MNNKLHYRFRRLLTEADENFNVNKCAAFVNTDEDVGPFQIVIYDPRKFIQTLKKYNPHSSGRLSYVSMKSLLVEDGAIVASIKLHLDQGKDYPCMGAAEVIQSAVGSSYQGQGVGKLLYRLAIAGLKQPIMADRGSTSDKAKRIWKSMEKDSSFKKLPPDKPPYIGVFDGNDVTPPEDDDCKINPDGDGESGDPLNKAYILKDTSEERQTLAILVNKHKVFMDKLREDQDKYYAASMVTEKFLLDCGLLLFLNVYAD